MTADDDAWVGSLLALREIGATRRGLPDEFFKVVGLSYTALLAEDEPHPVKALAEMHHVVISTASRWIKEARRRGYIEDGEEQS
jgi:DNA-binding MarR family transcriptional regulator